MSNNSALFSRMNRYEGRTSEFGSEVVFTPPRRTMANGWAKFHATRGCGDQSVRYTEVTDRSARWGRSEYELTCSSCQHAVDEDEVLFIGGDWFREKGASTYGRPIDRLQLSSEKVLELGPNPSEEVLQDALHVSRIERDVSVLDLQSDIDYSPCSECEKDTFLYFDGRCRMCYEGPWTPRLQKAVQIAGTSVRERNGSFVHTLERKVDPFAIKDRAFCDMILWRRHKDEPTSKLVEVTQCLKDPSDGHWEYILTDMTHTEQWRYHEDDLATAFWDTGLHNADNNKPIEDSRLNNLHNQISGK